MTRMNKRNLSIFLIFLVAVGGTGAWLMRVQGRLALGNPGVKLGNRPIYGEKSNVVSEVSVLLPEHVPGYKTISAPITDVELAMLPADTTFGRKYYYAPDRFNIQLNTILMGRDRMSLHPPEFCITGQGWRVGKSEVITLPMKRPVPYDLKIQKLPTMINFKDKNGEWAEYHGLFLYWFVTDELLTPSRFERMWWMSRDLLTTGTVERWGYISYFSYALPGQEDALLERMKSFIQETLPEFQIPPGNVEQPAKVAALD